MLELIKTDVDSCEGCNGCIRACPVEEANIAYLDDNGKVKVKIDTNKCIHCGACIQACPHGARYYVDDTKTFFSSIKKGEQLSLIVAPAYRVNYSKADEILGKLKALGIQKIYDVSLGADICTWVHIRYMQKTKGAKVISQPCPAIVNYVLAHKPELINHLSPVHSPMMCVAIYMKKYKHINTKIAALSPCIAKADEFSDTGLIDYNVTYKNLDEYIKDNNISLNNSWNGYDNIASSLGAIYSMAGGLKENVEFYLGDALQIAKSEGTSVYEMLDEYAENEKHNLPDIFDVLNCEHGCNFGTGCNNENTLFEVNSKMFHIKRDAMSKNKKTILNRMTKLFKFFDKHLKLEDFIRTYKPKTINKITVSESEIENAFNSLEKKTIEQRNHNCHACGLATCHDMAVSIAKGINIPENCIEKSRQVAIAEQNNAINLLESNKRSSFELTSLLERMTAELKSIDVSTLEIATGNNDTATDLCKIASEISEIQNISNEVLNSLNSIDSSVNEYHTMGETVSDIARQTKILAINASIEASRAGSFGASFSVIATEIKNLADTTSSAVADALNARELSESAIIEIKSVTTKLNEALNIIGDYISRVSASAEEISAQTEEISSSTKSVYENTTEVNDLAQSLTIDR